MFRASGPKLIECFEASQSVILDPKGCGTAGFSGAKIKNFAPKNQL
jgi:hypothetical protein